MRAVLAILVVCLIGKDLAFVPFPQIVRGCAQGLCLIVGIFAVLPALSGNLLRRYWPMLVYLLVLLLAVPFTEFPGFVTMQIGSLMSAIVFAIGYFENRSEPPDQKLKWLMFWIVLVYAIVSALCLILIKIDPTQAYESMFIGDIAGIELRFRGLFSKSAQMAAAGGILLGLAMIRVKSIPLKLSLIVLGLTCLTLPQCRSFWVAALIAGGATIWLYFRHLRKWIIVSCGALAVLTLSLLAFNVSVDTTGLAAFARVNTISTLTGRTSLWQSAFDGWSQKPLLGYGFTLGGAGLNFGEPLSPNANPTEISRRTLHNGYVQSLLDSGLVGLLFYVTTILIAISRICRYDRARQFPEVLYVLLFLSISNGGESVIYSGSVFQSLCFWIFATFAMSLKRGPLSAPSSTVQPITNKGRGVISRFPNLMH
jgi:O-antigen ligase